jgi:hypothetical protein
LPIASLKIQMLIANWRGEGETNIALSKNMITPPIKKNPPGRDLS